jgi:NDP-sugar pyrophosphorylase family protein
MITHGLILAAGLGTRLRPLTLERAKPAMPVGGIPIIRRIITWLTGEGVTDLVVNLHHRPETITALVGDGSDLGARVRYSWEQPAILGSAGGPRHALPIIGAKTFFIVNGDTLTDLALQSLAGAHAATKAMVTMALVPNREPDRYGGVRMGEDGQISGFVSRGAQAAGSYHFIGAQVADAEVFAGLKDGDAINSTHGVYDTLIASTPGSIRGYLCNAAFWDIGTPEDYAATDKAFQERPSA